MQVVSQAKFITNQSLFTHTKSCHFPPCTQGKHWSRNVNCGQKFSGGRWSISWCWRRTIVLINPFKPKLFNDLISNELISAVWRVVLVPEQILASVFAQCRRRNAGQGWPNSSEWAAWWIRVVESYNTRKCKEYYLVFRQWICATKS